MKKSVAVVYGGDSSEYLISVGSGKNISRNLDRERFDVYEIFIHGGKWSLCDGSCDEPLPVAEVDKNDFSVTVNGHKVRFDVAYITIHGTPGENGLLQGYLEMLGIPHTTCRSHVASVIFDKCSCKRFLSHSSVKMAPDVYLRRNVPYDCAEILSQLKLPLFVKPVIGGSSFGISKVKVADELEEAIRTGFREGDALIIEQGIQGRELTQGVYRNGSEIVALPVTEIIPEGEYFDYEAKYLGKSREICPAQIPPEVARALGESSRRIYEYLGCSGIVRIDYIWDGSDIWFLELNVTPGMTQMSIVPVQVREAGIEIGDFLSTIIDGAI